MEIYNFHTFYYKDLFVIDMNNDAIIIRSFCDGKKVQVSKLLHWLAVDIPQTSVLKRFLIQTYPTLTESKDNDETWNLDGYGGEAAAQSMMTFFMNLNEKVLIPVEVDAVLSWWLGGGFFVFVPSQWHRCNHNCNVTCIIKQNSLKFLEYLARKIFAIQASNLYAQVTRMAILYHHTVILDSMKSLSLEFTFKNEIAISMFFSTVLRDIKMFIFNHSSQEFKNEIMRVLADEKAEIVTKHGLKFNSSEVYIHISDMIAILDPIKHMQFRAELNITNLSLSDFISACDAGNFPLVKSMIDVSFPAYIRKRDHLTQILRALSDKENCAEWNSVFNYVVRASDGVKAKLHAEDTICFMVRDFFKYKHGYLSTMTNWDRPPEFRNGSPLLYDFELLQELETNKKLAVWCAKPRHSRIDADVSHPVNPKCLRILSQYNLFGVFYH